MTTKWCYQVLKTFLCSKNYSLFHFVFLKLFIESNNPTILKKFKNNLMFLKIENHF